MRAALILFALLLAGCSADPAVMRWSKTEGYGTQADLDRDDARCRNEGMAIAGINPAAYAGTVFRNCMVAAGWTPRG